MRVTAHQPDFLPWAGFWNKVVSSDVIVLLDKVQLGMREYHNRVRIEGVWLTLPLVNKGTYDTAIYERKELRRIIRTIEQRLMSKKQNPYGARLQPLVDALAELECSNRITLGLLELNLTCFAAIARILDIEVDARLVSTWVGQDKTTRMWHSLKEVVPEITEYYSGIAGEEYLNSFEFGVPVKVQRVINPYGGNSILQLIARESDPLTLIKECAEWTNFSSPEFPLSSLLPD